MKDKKTLWLSGILVGLLALTVFAAPAFFSGAYPAGRGDTLDLGDIRAQAAEDATPSMDDQALRASLWKIDPALRAILDSGDKEFAKVVIITKDVGALGRAVQQYDYRGLIGTNARPTGQSVPVTLELPASSLPKIASLGSVSAIYDYKTPVLDFIPRSEWAPLELPSAEQVPWSLEMAKGGDLEEVGDFAGLQAVRPPPELQDFASTEFFMDAVAAWANGFTGDGVFVAVPDQGVDFAHPDLQGTQARFNISTVSAEVLAEKPYLSAYDGWPIAFDPSSIDDFLGGEGDLADPDVVAGFWGYVPTTTVLQVNASGDFINFTRSSPLDTVLEFNDQQIFQDDISPDFPDIFLQAGLYRRPFEVLEGSVLLLVEVDMQATAADVDAALFYDSNGDGDIDIGELVSWQDTSTGADPEVFPPIRNPDTENDWILVVLGYETDDPGLVDITITMVSIADLETPYDVTTIASVSGDYHVGLYPDANLEAAYFIPPAVLVVDETTLGVYDTVYVDLDNDFDFTDEKPGVLGDEILYADIDGDGLADISGGMVYFISNATAVPEYDVLTALGGETYANLADGNIGTPERITVELNDTVWRTTSVSSLLIITADGGETDVQLDDTNLVGSSVALDGTEIEVLDELALTVEDPSADTGFEVSNGGLLDITVFRERQTDEDGEDDWFGPTLVELTDPEDYTFLPSGVVTFTAKLTNNPNPFEANAIGDEFHVFYNYTGMMNPETAFTVDYAAGTISLTYPLKAAATIAADYEYYNWVLDYVAGNLTFTHPLGPGDVISAAYQYGWVPIPYSDVLAERLGVDNFYAGNGDLVAFMGPFGGAHGTEVASQIVSQGNSLFGRTRGVAPDAKIIAIGMIPEWDTVNSAYFSVEGYDGVPGTGDEANIMSNSWGYSASVTGWEFDDRFFDWLATNYSKGNTSITFSAGNSGQGYGTVTSPSAPGIIMVGGAEHFFYRVVPEELSRSFDSGPNPMGGDATDFASRGPTATGQFGTDVIGAAEFVHASIPLNDLGPDFDGFSAVDFVSGTSFSSPAAAGVLALAYDAYKERVGEFPDTYTIKAILMSGSEDIDNDVIVQGAGYVNALGATNIANGLGGAFVTPYNWIPGDYRGDSYEVFARLMEPGDSEMQTFTLTNTNGTAVDYDVAGETLAKFGEVQYTYNPPDLLQPHSLYGDLSLFYILNGTGIWDAYTNTLVQAIDPALWNNADLLRITEATPSDYPGAFVLEIHRFTDGIANSDWTGHTDEVGAVDISPDGTMMASAGADGRIFVVDLGTSEILWEFDHPGPAVPSGSFTAFDIKFAPNNTWLAASLGDFNISIWDVSSGSLVDTLTAPSEVIAIDLSPNGTWMVAGQYDANVTIWDITTSTMVDIFDQTLSGPVNDVAFSPNGTWVASTDYGEWNVTLWNVTTLTVEDIFAVDPTQQLGFPMAVEFNPANGEEVAVGWKYGWYLRSLGVGPGGLPGAGYPDVAVYDIGLGDYTGWWAGHGDVVTDISWSADGSMIASSSGLRPDLGGDDNSVKIWDATANDVMLENVERFLAFVNKVAFAPGGVSFAAADDDWAALIVDTTDSGLLQSTVTTALIDEFDYGIWYERNRQVTSFAQTGVESARVSDPAVRDPEGILIWARDLAGSSVDTTVTITIEFYEKSTWGWLDLSSSTVTVPADGTATFDATMDVPSDAAIGAYEGAIYLRNDTWGDIVVPVMVNVLGNSPMIEFGGNLLTSDLYDNNRLYTWSGTDGDRRFYFFDVADSFVLRDGMKLLVDIDMTFANSYGDIRHYQQTARGAEIVGPDDRYGPFVLEETDIGAPGLFKKTLDWQDQGNGLVKGLSAGPGLNLLEVQGAILDGSTFYETIAGETGLMTFNPYPVEITTNSLDGLDEDALSLTLTSTVAWEANPDPFDPNYGKAMAVTVAGAESETFENLVVLQDDPDDPFTSSFVKTVVLENIVSIVFHIEGLPADDLDLFVHFDTNGNGVLDTTDERMGSSTTPTAIETVSLLLPLDGTYFILVHGWSVPAGSTTFTLTIDTLATGAAPVELAGIPAEVEPNQPATALLEWSLPTTQADGDTTAAFFVSPGNAPLSLALLVPVAIHLDRVEPTISDLAPAPGATIAGTTPNILATFADPGQLDRNFFSILLDGVDIAGLVDLVIPFGDGGYFSGLVTFKPATDLAEGSHTIEIQVKDLAGNVAKTSWTFTVDTTGPSLTLTSPPEDLATTSSSLSVSGLTEPGASVTVGIQSVAVDSQGAFFTVVTLNPGANAIVVIATDPMGNSATLTRIVTLDTSAPVISQVTSTAGLLTNQGSTTIRGTVDEAASVTVGGVPTIVRPDGTFELSMTLAEGSNAISIVATDLAGNQATQTLTVIRDAVQPILALEALPSETSSATITVSGSVESGINFVTVNGQPVPVSAGAFSTDVALSFGSNEIFVEATDAAGNTKAIVAAVSYVPSGVSVASVGLILLPILTVVALLLGLLIGGIRRGRPPKEAMEMAPPQEGEP